MKKSLVFILTFVFLLGIFGTAAAANLSAFSDVPTSNWAYGAIQQLYRDGIIDGYGDGTFRGNNPITRYEMAMIIARAMTRYDSANPQDRGIIEKLEAEYTDELQQIGALDQRVTTLESKADKALFYGMLRGEYDNQQVNGKNLSDGNNYFYFNFQGQFKVNDNWTANFQSENFQSYQMVSGTGSTSNTQNDVFERVWATGKVGDVGVTMGRKWDNDAYSKAEGCEATGVWLNYGKDFSTTIFYAKPDSQGSWVSGTQNGPDWNISMYGVRFADKVSDTTNLGLEIGGNNNGNGIGFESANINSWGGVSFDTKLGQDFKLAAEYAKTNADSYNHNLEGWLIYKGANLAQPNSYDIYLRYDYLDPNGSLTYDNEFGTLAADTKGLGVGFDWVLGKNVEWSTTYYNDKFIAGGYNYGGETVQAGQSRKLIRTHLDFNF